MHPSLRVLGSRSSLEFAKGACWQWMECHLVRTHCQIWISLMMWLYLPSYWNSSYLHLRRWHQNQHLSGWRWTVRRQKSKLWAAGRTSHWQFLADRTNGRAYATVLRLSSSSVVCLSVTLCIVAKRCVLEQKLLLRAYRKSYMRNRLVPKWMTLTFV